MTDMKFSPLAEFSNLESLKKQFEGRYFQWCFRLYSESRLFVVTPVEVDLYRLAAGVMHEETEPEGKVVRRKGFREAIKSIFNTGDMGENTELNAILLSYFCTYDGALNYLSDKNPPEIGILVEQNVDVDEDLQILMVPKDLFFENYKVLFEGKSLKELF